MKLLTKMTAAEVGRIWFNQTRVIATASSELTHMNHHSHNSCHSGLQRLRWCQLVGLQYHLVRRYCSQVDGGRRLVHHENSDLYELSLSRLDAIHSEMKKQSCVSFV